MTEETPGPNRFAVLDVFGITLEVSNPRLAELLTMDASDALTSDVRDLVVADRRAVAEGLPDVVVSMPSPHTEALARARLEFRKRADALGGALGFIVEHDGTWSSPTGIDIVTRTVERSLTVAAASHFVAEVSAVTDRLPESTAVLFIVDDQQAADVFKVAIRQRRMHNLMRTVSLETLEEVSARHAAGRIDHRGVLVLLAPIANIDAGEILSVLRADDEAMPHSDDAAAE
ncbi:hypothetical protein EG835_07900 [bacterium]|nr:hypothetical protein [bacterium]